MRTIRNCFSNRLFGIFEVSEPVICFKLSYMSQGSADRQNWNSKIILDFIIRRFVETALFIRPVKTIGSSGGSFKHIQRERSCDTYTEITQLNHFS